MKPKFNFLPVLFLFIAVLSSSQDYWQPINIYGGEIKGLSPNSSGIYALRSDNVYFSGNFGANWTKISSVDFFGILECVNAAQSGYVFVGMQGGGIWWTSNNGQSWDFDRLHVSGQGQWATVSAIGVNPAGNIFASTALTGHFRSNNNGQTWVIFEIQGLDPLDGVTEYSFKQNDKIFISTTNGIFRSTNDGATWQPVNSSGFTNTIIVSVSGNIFAGTRNSGIIYSSNNGDSWVSRNSGLGNLEVKSIRSSSDGRLFAATSGDGVYTSTNDGISWSKTGNGTGSFVNSIGILPGRVFAGSRNGVTRTDDNGGLWVTSNNNMRLNFVNSVCAKPTGKIFVASQWAIYYSSDNGNNWHIRTTGLPEDYSVVSITKNAAGTIYSLLRKQIPGVISTRIYSSEDDGQNWTYISSDLESNNISKILAEGSTIAAIEKVSNTAFKVFVSTNSGSVWQKKLDRSSVLFKDILINQNSDLFVFFQDFGLNDSLLRSTDAGNNWQFLTSAVLQFSPIKCISINQANGNIYSIRSNKLRSSTDNGNSWQGDNVIPWMNGFVVPGRIAISPTDLVFATTFDDGVFMTTDNGMSWENNSSGIPYTFNGNQNVYSQISSFAFDGSGFIYAATSNDGIYRSTQSTISVNMISSEVPGGFSLHQNYPNPFNPSTKIEFDIPSAGHTDLSIFDIQGKKILTIVSTKLNHGKYSYIWNAATMPSGVYFYVIASGSFKQTKKMILLK